MSHFYINLLVAIVMLPGLGALAQGNDVEAIAERAFEILKAKNYDAAFPLMKQAAEGGDCISQGLLGTMYYEGKGCTVDYEQARFWWTKANKGGCNEANSKWYNELMTTKLIVVDNVYYLVNDNGTLTATYADTNGKKVYAELTDVVIPASVTYNGKTYRVTTIGESAFSGCRNLKSVKIAESVETIGDYAFNSCESLATVSVLGEPTAVGAGAFGQTAWLNAQPDGVVYVGKAAYRYKGEMPAGTSITLREGTTWITDYAFSGNENLTAITMPSTVFYIGTNAFKKCAGLSNAALPASLRVIGPGAFMDCSSLISVKMPDTVTHLGRHAFIRCKKLKEVLLSNSIDYIPEEVFDDCESLTSIVIPNSVKVIGGWAFNQCSGLKSVTIGTSVQAIGEGAFRYCDRLKKIVIPDNVIYIGYDAFTLGDLRSVRLSASLKYIGAHAFSDNKDLEEVICPMADPASIELGDEYVFYKVPAYCKYKVPKASMDAYKNANVWSDLNIVEQR